MQKRIKIVISIAMAVMVLFAAIGCSSQTAANTSIVDVKTAAASKHTLQTTLDIAGVLVPAQTVNIFSKLSGQVIDMSYNVGDSVKAGDTLIKLETKSLNAQLLQAQAGLKTAEATMQSAQNQSEQAKIDLDMAQKNYDRKKALYDQGIATKSDLDDVANKLDIAKKKYENAMGSTTSTAQAAIGKSNADINNIRVQMENSIIKSPINGIIVNRNINPGEIATSPSSSPLLTIADTSVLKLKGTISQEVLPMLQIGQEINVTIDIYPDKVFKGKIAGIGPMAVSTGTIFPIEISIENTENIIAGLSAHASIDIAEAQGVVVPSSAVVQNNGASYVYVVKGSVVEKRTVTLGIRNDKEIEILKGLNEGEKVAVTNVNSLFNNMPVNAN